MGFTSTACPQTNERPLAVTTIFIVILFVFFFFFLGGGGGVGVCGYRVLQLFWVRLVA